MITKMMYTVLTELKQPDKNRAIIGEAIKKLGRWAEPVSASFLVDVDWEADRLRNYFRPFLLEGDKLVVLSLGKQWSSYRLSPSVSKWIKAKNRKWA